MRATVTVSKIPTPYCDSLPVRPVDSEWWMLVVALVIYLTSSTSKGLTLSVLTLPPYAWNRLYSLSGHRLPFKQLFPTPDCGWRLFSSFHIPVLTLVTLIAQQIDRSAIFIGIFPTWKPESVSINRGHISVPSLSGFIDLFRTTLKTSKGLVLW